MLASGTISERHMSVNHIIPRWLRRSALGGEGYFQPRRTIRLGQGNFPQPSKAIKTESESIKSYQIISNGTGGAGGWGIPVSTSVSLPNGDESGTARSYRPRSVSSLLMRLRAMTNDLEKTRASWERSQQEKSGFAQGHVRLRLCVERKKRKKKKEGGKEWAVGV